MCCYEYHYAECRYTECLYTECRYAEDRYAEYCGANKISIKSEGVHHRGL